MTMRSGFEGEDTWDSKGISIGMYTCCDNPENNMIRYPDSSGSIQQLLQFPPRAFNNMASTEMRV